MEESLEQLLADVSALERRGAGGSPGRIRQREEAVEHDTDRDHGTWHGGHRRGQGGGGERPADRAEAGGASAGEDHPGAAFQGRALPPADDGRFQKIEEDDAIRVVVETIGGVEAAYEYTKRALNAGKHVVTANKQLVAEKGCELLALAKKQGVNYLFEASVGGGIPVLHPLTQCMAANRIDEVYGILNGTTNYILTRMVRTGASFCRRPAGGPGQGLCRGGSHRRCGGHRRRTEDLHPGGSGLRPAGGSGGGAHGGHQPGCPCGMCGSPSGRATASSCWAGLSAAWAAAGRPMWRPT